jgi:hypothetical protein
MDYKNNESCINSWHIKHGFGIVNLHEQTKFEFPMTLWFKVATYILLGQTHDGMLCQDSTT